MEKESRREQRQKEEKQKVKNRGRKVSSWAFFRTRYLTLPLIACEPAIVHLSTYEFVSNKTVSCHRSNNEPILFPCSHMDENDQAFGQIFEKRDLE